MMKKHFYIFLLLGAVFSCDKTKDSAAPLVDSCPMTIGTEWTYDRFFITENLESETSDKITSRDTQAFTVRVWIEKDTVLKGKNIVVFQSQDNGYGSISSSYMYLDNEGLKTFAYFSPGWESIIYEETPTIEYQLPMTANAIWTYRKPSSVRKLQIDKEVIGHENISALGQSFNCYKIKWTYLYDESDSDIEVTEWISDKGMIKKETKYGVMNFRDERGTSLGYFQNTEILLLKELTVK